MSEAEEELEKILDDLDEKDLRLFACWCCRQVWHKLSDERIRKVVEVSERFAVGEASEDELEEAKDAAWNADWSAARDAAWNAAWCAAREAARGAAWYAAWNAAWNAANQACEMLCKDVSEEEVFEVIREAQVEWLS